MFQASVAALLGLDLRLVLGLVEGQVLVPVLGQVQTSHRLE